MKSSLRSLSLNWDHPDWLRIPKQPVARMQRDRVPLRLHVLTSGGTKAAQADRRCAIYPAAPRESFISWSLLFKPSTREAHQTFLSSRNIKMGTASSPSYDVVIIGAGIAGLSAGIALTLKGHKVTVIERTSSLQSIGSILLIPPQVSRLLDSYGVFNRLFEKDTVRDGLDWLRYADGSVLGRSDFTWQKGVYGYPYVFWI